MNGKKYEPPKWALWLLMHACPGDNNGALAGDLVERFREGQTYRWLWMQVLIAFAAGVLGWVRRHWPHFSYAIAGTLLFLYFEDARALQYATRLFHWRALPWPWSQIGSELSHPALLGFSALPVLAAGLVMEGSFRWIYLLRTAAINLTLIGFGHFSPDICPWLLRPAPGYNPYHMKMFIIPFAFQWLLLFSNFLISAWLGCLSLRPAERRRFESSATPSRPEQRRPGC
jgi:hypothetical protein